MKPLYRLPSLRRPLLSIHCDLLKIHASVDPCAAYSSSRLTEFERYVLVLEDRRFFYHGGVDWLALLRETLKPLVLRRPRGASTIDMQFVRTATARYERTIARKLREVLLAHLIQFRYSKIVILRSYLSIAYFGTGLKGAQDATKSRVDDITGMDAALLASQLVFPKPRRPNDLWHKRLLRRANYINSIYIRYKKRFDKLERRIFQDIA